MSDFVMPLLLGLDISSLTMSLVNIASPSGGETPLADSIETALRPIGHLAVERIGDTVVARTDAGHAERVIVAAHLDTGPAGDQPLAFVEMGKIFGPGASDAKGALAASLKAAALGGYRCDVTFVYYAGGTQWWSGADGTPTPAGFALLAEPTNGTVLGGALGDPWTRRLAGLCDTDSVADAGDAHGLVARIASLGIPAVAFGPGDPALAGAPDEFVPTAELARCEFVLRQWLTAEL